MKRSIAIGRLAVAAVVVAGAAGCTRDTAYLISNKLASVITRSEERLSYSQYEADRRTRYEGPTLAASLGKLPDVETVRREVLKIVPVGTPTTAAYSSLTLNGFSCTWDTAETGRCFFPDAGSRELTVSTPDGKVADVVVVTAR